MSYFDSDIDCSLKGADMLIADITDTRNMLSSIGLSSLPVGNADAGSYFNTKVLQAIDYGVCQLYIFPSIALSNGLSRWRTCTHGLLM